MDEVWQAFNETEDGKAYVAHAEQPTVLCAYGKTGSIAMNKMSNLMVEYPNAYPIASSISYDFESELWNVTIAINWGEDGL